MDRPRVALAGPEDSQALLEILEQSPLPGGVKLLYSRRPDAWESLQSEGREVLVYKLESGARWAAAGQPAPADIAAFGACAVNSLLVDGQPRDVGYLFSFRIRPGQERAAAWFPGGYRFHFDQWRQRGVKRFLTTILSDNLAARKLLEKNRPSMPRYHYLGDIFTYSQRCRRRPARLPRFWSFGPARPEDLGELLEFRRKEGLRYQYFPLVEEADLVEDPRKTGRRAPVPPLDCWYLLRDDRGKIAACGALWDQRKEKPYIVAGYQGLSSLLQPLSPWLSPLLGLPLLPPAGSTLKQFCAAFLLARGGETDKSEGRALGLFLDSLAAVGAEHPQGFDFFTWGLHQDNPLVMALRHRRGLVLKSRLYEVMESPKASLPLSPASSSSQKRIPYIEIGRL